MEKLELLKKMISDISHNSKYNGAVFYGGGDGYFAFYEGKIYVIEWKDLSCFSIHFTPEEKQEVERIENELKLSYLTFLPIRGGVAYDLQSLIEYYTGGEDYDEEDEEAEDYDVPEVKDKINEIKKLQAVFEDETSIFYHRESHFLDLFLYSEVEISDAPYVCSAWDHDDAYYYGLPFSTGACVLLYDMVVDDESFDELDYIENNNELSTEEKEGLCDRWIEILSEIDKYIVK